MFACQSHRPDFLVLLYQGLTTSKPAGLTDRFQNTLQDPNVHSGLELVALLLEILRLSLLWCLVDSPTDTSSFLSRSFTCLHTLLSAVSSSNSHLLFS